ncbi:MAG TPA: class I SAM-dependent methyltransferase [Pseudonocardiaceae bacterium]|nr:class I SAM-dependent methyltransferase [Pseudonocardiaceae bacterium]
MAYSFTADDVVFLRSAAGADALAALAALPLTAASRLTDAGTARAVAGDRFAATLETAVLRRRATVKLGDPAAWLLCDAALQQATPTAVARHRATRLRNRDVHDVTCSIGADLVELAVVAGRCVGSDLDEVRLAMAAANCAHFGVDPLLVRADALRPVTRDTAVLADPARRDDTGRRRWHPDGLVPPLPELVAAYPGRDLVVKCAPGLDFAAVPWAAEIELVSLDGAVREACLWTGSLATAGISRRATVLRGTQWTITDAEPDDCPVRPVGEWLIDPDGAVVRAGLVRHYAARHGLGQLDPRIAYLTGDTPPPGTRAFRVLDHGRYSEKTLRATLRSFDVGSLEILVRGLAVQPDELRKRLRLSGSVSATVVLTRIGDTPTAFLCEAHPAVD